MRNSSNLVLISVATIGLVGFSMRLNADGACANECQVRSSFGNRLVKGDEEEFKKAQELFNQITKDNITACREACKYEGSAHECKVCAKQALPDETLKGQKEQLDAFACSEEKSEGKEKEKEEGEEEEEEGEDKSEEKAEAKCVALQQPQFNYSAPAPRSKSLCAADVLKEAEQHAKNARNLEKKADALYDAGFDETVTPIMQQRQYKVAAAEPLSLQATFEKMREADLRDFLDERPFDGAKNFCVPACTARLPINGMSLSSYFYSEAMWSIPALIKKAIFECVRACAFKPNSECGACAASTIDTQFQGVLYGTIAARFKCGVEPNRQPPTAGHIVLQTFADLLGGGATEPCPKMNGVNTAVTMGLGGRQALVCHETIIPPKK